MFYLGSHKLIAIRDVIFHENTNDDISKYDVWYTPYDNDDHVKIDIDGRQEQIQEQKQVQVQEQSGRNMDTANTLDSPKRDPSPLRR